MRDGLKDITPSIQCSRCRIIWLETRLWRIQYIYSHTHSILECIYISNCEKCLQTAAGDCLPFHPLGLNGSARARISSLPRNALFLLIYVEDFFYFILGCVGREGKACFAHHSSRSKSAYLLRHTLRTIQHAHQKAEAELRCYWCPLAHTEKHKEEDVLSAPCRIIEGELERESRNDGVDMGIYSYLV